MRGRVAAAARDDGGAGASQDAFSFLTLLKKRGVLSEKAHTPPPPLPLPPSPATPSFCTCVTCLWNTGVHIFVFCICEVYHVTQRRAELKDMVVAANRNAVEMVLGARDLYVASDNTEDTIDTLNRCARARARSATHRCVARLTPRVRLHLCRVYSSWKKHGGGDAGKASAPDE